MKGNLMHKARAALALHPRCGSRCRTTGQPCRNAAMSNGRCRMHGGRSTGRPVIHGRYTKLALAERARWVAAEKELRQLIKQCE